MSNITNSSIPFPFNTVVSYVNSYGTELGKYTNIDNTIATYALATFTGLAIGACVALPVWGAFSWYNKHKDKKRALAEENLAQKNKEAKREAKAQAAREKLEAAWNEVYEINNRNEQTLIEYGIKNWYIPLKGPDGKILEGTHQFETKDNPIFDSNTRQILSTIKSMISQSTESEGNIALPNLLIQGKSGVGKTMLIHELMQATFASGAGYIYIPTKCFENQLIAGTYDRAFHQLVAVAKSSKVPVYFVLEDGEYLFKHRSKDSANVVEGRRIELVDAFLASTGDDKRKFSILMSTKKPEAIDEAFNTRVMPIVLQQPGADERRKIIDQLVKDTIWGESEESINRFFNPSRIEKMAANTEGFTCDNLKTLVETIRDCIALKRGMDQGLIDSSIELLRNKSI